MIQIQRENVKSDDFKGLIIKYESEELDSSNKNFIKSNTLSWILNYVEMLEIQKRILEAGNRSNLINKININTIKKRTTKNLIISLK